MAQEQQLEEVPKKRKSYKGLVIISLIFLGLSLPFHYLPERFMVFPKDHLTFSNTYISQDDIDRLIERYNDASFFEKQAINQEPLVRKLMEQGVLVERKPKE